MLGGLTVHVLVANFLTVRLLKVRKLVDSRHSYYSNKKSEFVGPQCTFNSLAFILTVDMSS